ncbi:MAG: serine/threonine protein kinase [Kofleriaceae bacterium]|nr:serine/threonine protein kinase [Kofleriaceae bacterium]
MATVYRARDAQLRRDVAIKVMFPHLARKPEVARRFQREARAAAGLEHPNILRVYDVGGGKVAGRAADEPPYIVMELVRGHSLRDLVEATGPMLAEVVACVGAVLCDALAVAHAAGVIHRDVKPGNVLVAEDGRLLLADFGVARVEDDDSLVTRTGALLGTPSFMSPEQAHGDALDGRSDVYSVGATLYQLATGSLPFAGSTAVVVAAISRGEYTEPLRRRPQLGAELSRLIERLMHREPDQRPASAAAAAAVLREAAAAAASFAEPREELGAYFADPAGFEAARRPLVVARCLARARARRRQRARCRARSAWSIACSRSSPTTPRPARWPTSSRRRARVVAGRGWRRPGSRSRRRPAAACTSPAATPARPARPTPRRPAPRWRRRRRRPRDGHRRRRDRGRRRGGRPRRRGRHGHADRRRADTAP